MKWGLGIGDCKRRSFITVPASSISSYSPQTFPSYTPEISSTFATSESYPYIQAQPTYTQQSPIYNSFPQPTINAINPNIIGNDSPYIPPAQYTLIQNIPNYRLDYLRDLNINISDTADDFRAYLAHRMIDDGIRGITLVNERSFISTFYDWAVSAELVMRNPVKMTDPIKVPREPKKSFTEIEVEKIRSACRTLKEKAIVETLFSTACRVSELTSIKTADIDENRVMICGKGHKYGQIYLTSKAMYAIDQYVSSRKDDNPYLIPGTKKRGMSNMGVEKVLKQIGERAGVDDVHPHRFRRTAATMAFRRGMSIEMVSKMLRHNRLQTTMIYLDISDEELMYQHKKYAG